jgi:hypothetical protein
MVLRDMGEAVEGGEEQKTGDAFMRVRGLDLSDRPWDDGYSRPRRPGDTSEQHPYQFNSSFRVWKQLKATGLAL